MNNSVTIAYSFELHFTTTSLDGSKPWNIDEYKKVHPNSSRTSSYFDSTYCDDCVIKGGLDQRFVKPLSPKIPSLRCGIGLEKIEEGCVRFLEHVPYFSVLASSHHLTQPELIKLDPFDDATETPQETPQEIPQKTPQETPTDTETPHVTIVTKPPPMATQSSTEVVIGPPPSGRPKRNCKSTKRDDFVAMAEELAALHQTQTWHLVRLLGAIGSRWVYRIKTKYDGSIERYKARLVAKGYAQEYGMNYEETFAPNAFLNGDLNEEVLMTPPPGVSHKPGEVCKLRKALYGLKQAPRACVGRTLLSLYVDDMIITVDDCVGIESLKLELAYRFAMKDLGLLHYFLVTRPDISYAVHIMSQFVSAPTTVHWAAVLHILMYLCGTQFQTLFFPSTSALDLRAYCDSDWASDVVSPEYHAMAVTTSEIVWLRWLLADMGIRISHSTLLHCDNHSAIQIAYLFTKPHSGSRFRFLNEKHSMFLAAALRV
ncbi:retrovirus-related pol polyprotein from transposon TNT 1-94 [Tanacetum coccineum]